MPNPERLFKSPIDITPQETRTQSELRVSTGRKAVLLRAMVDAYSQNRSIVAASGTYTQRTEDQETIEHIQDFLPTIDELTHLVKEYRNDPIRAQHCARTNLLHLIEPDDVYEEPQYTRLGRYLEDYLALIPRLDALAFPPDLDPANDQEPVVHQGVPAYLPDGLSDMGRHNEVDETKRVREKIRVNKHMFYTNQHVFKGLYDALWTAGTSSENMNRKEQLLVMKAMITSHTQLRYDKSQFGLRHAGRSVFISHFRQLEDPEAVCRHIAIDLQLCLQALGFDSRLLKCDLDGGSHAANLVEIAYQWYLADATNLERDDRDPSKLRPILKRVQVTEEAQQEWRVPVLGISLEGTLTESIWIYEAVSKMFYRIRNNKIHSAIL